VVDPDGYEQGWNDCRRVAATPAGREDVDDDGSVAALVGEVSARHSIDDRRVFAVGCPNGLR
jgi:polyhydroxybutyrate depolymerase